MVCFLCRGCKDEGGDGRQTPQGGKARVGGAKAPFSSSLLGGSNEDEGDKICGGFPGGFGSTAFVLWQFGTWFGI